MKSELLSSAVRRRRSAKPVWPLPLLPVASVLLAALTCLLGVYTPFHYEPVPDVKLPFTKNRSSGCYLFDGPGLTISAGADRRLYFSHGNRAIQTEVVRRVAARHGVRLNSRQLLELSKLSFLGLDVRHLLPYLALPPQERRQLHVWGISNNDSNDELTEYIAIGRAVTLEQKGYRAYVALELDKALPASDVNRIMRTIRQQGIHHCFIVANMQPDSF